MNSPSPHIVVLRAALGVQQETERFNAAHNFLRLHLVATRDMPIGRDFLFAAEATGVRAALKDLVEIEHAHGKDLHFDYTEIGGYFLLRIAGAPDERADIDAYFD
jgi:hypothetical protein